MGLKVGEGKGMPKLGLGLQDPAPQIYPGFHQHLVVWLPYPLSLVTSAQALGARGAPPTPASSQATLPAAVPRSPPSSRWNTC